MITENDSVTYQLYHILVSCNYRKHCPQCAPCVLLTGKGRNL